MLVDARIPKMKAVPAAKLRRLQTIEQRGNLALKAVYQDLGVRLWVQEDGQMIVHYDIYDYEAREWMKGGRYMMAGQQVMKL